MKPCPQKQYWKGTQSETTKALCISGKGKRFLYMNFDGNNFPGVAGTSGLIALIRQAQ